MPPRISRQLNPSNSVPGVQFVAAVSALTVPKKMQPFTSVGHVLGRVHSPSGPAAISTGGWALPLVTGKTEVTLTVPAPAPAPVLALSYNQVPVL